MVGGHRSPVRCPNAICHIRSPSMIAAPAGDHLTPARSISRSIRLHVPAHPVAADVAVTEEFRHFRRHLLERRVVGDSLVADPVDLRLPQR